MLTNRFDDVIQRVNDSRFKIAWVDYSRYIVCFQCGIIIVLPVLAVYFHGKRGKFSKNDVFRVVQNGIAFHN